MPRFLLSYTVLICGLASGAGAQVCTEVPVRQAQEAKSVLSEGQIWEGSENGDNFTISAGFREPLMIASSHFMAAMAAQESGPIEVTAFQAAGRRLSKAEPLRVPNHIADCKTVIGYSIPIRVVVDERGNVISAEPVNRDGLAITRNLLALAKSQASTGKYRPFVRDGKPVRVTFIEPIRILPPEDLPKSHVPFPEASDWRSLRITLQRNGFEGYKIEIRGDGVVLYSAYPYSNLVTGEHRDHISHSALAEIINAFRQTDYFSLRDEYLLAASVPSKCGIRMTSFRLEGHSKSVRHCNGEENGILRNGEEAGMPQSIIGLEEAIDRLAETGKWVQGDAETVPSLVREGLDFTSPQASRLLRSAMSRGAIGVVRDLLAKGVSPDGRDASGEPLLHGAVKAGPGMARTLLDYRADPKVIDREGNSILMVAAQTGSPELVSEILKYRLDVNGRNYKDESVIEAAVMGYGGSPSRINVLDEGRAEVVRLLAKAGADVNVRDEEGNTPLHKIGDWCVVQALIESGADVNARNNHGQTPLITTRSRKVAHLLVQAGADISARDHDGNTALKTVLENKEDNVGIYLYFTKSPVAELEK